MEFRRSGQSQQRRRRVFLDDHSSDQGAAPPSGREKSPPAADSTGAPVCGYSELALADRQPAITDLIPTRAFTLLLLLLTGLLATAAINALNLQVVQAGTNLTADEVAPFRMSGGDTLLGWFSSLLLAGAAAAALLIFNIRRHRLDDYRGRYRLWVWAAVLLVYASIDMQAELHRTLDGQFARLVGGAAGGDGAVWRVGLYCAVFGLMAIWMFLETKASRTTAALLVATASCYGAAALYALQWLPALAATAPLQTMLEANCLLAGHFLLCCSLAAFARHVNLEAQGRIKPRRAKAKKAAVASDAAASGKPRRTTPAPAAPRPSTKRTDLESPAAATSPRRAAVAGQSPKPESAAKPSASKPAPADSDDGLDSEQNLSKSERRRLRKLQRRQQRGVEV